MECVTSTLSYPAAAPRDFWLPSTVRISVFCVAFSHEVCPLPENKAKLWGHGHFQLTAVPLPNGDFAFTDPMTRILQDKTPREIK